MIYLTCSILEYRVPNDSLLHILDVYPNFIVIHLSRQQDSGIEGGGQNKTKIGLVGRKLSYYQIKEIEQVKYKSQGLAAFSLTIKYALLISLGYIPPCLTLPLHNHARSQALSHTFSLTMGDTSHSVIHLSPR